MSDGTNGLDERISRLGELQQQIAEERAELLELKHSEDFEEETLEYEFGEVEQASNRADVDVHRRILFPLNLSRDDFEEADYDRHLDEFETFSVEGNHKHTIELNNGIVAHIVIDDREFDLSYYRG